MPCNSALHGPKQRAILTVALCFLSFAPRLAAQDERTFKGEITKTTCAGPSGQAAMTCTGKTNTTYVLSIPGNKTIYQLDDQKKVKSLAGEAVVVVGVLDKSTGTIQVAHIVRALPARITQAKTVSIVCDACLRGMAAANGAAFEELADWRRFDIIPERRKADLIFLFSANPYLGDYVTRDGPDTRQVHVDITYMNVIDPRTGESLWGDSRQWGSWFVARATKSLIAEFRKQLEIGDSQAERLMVLMDRHHEGGVTKEEFLRYMDAEFDRLDTDKNGKLDVNELRQLRVVNIDSQGDDDP